MASQAPDSTGHSRKARMLRKQQNQFAQDFEVEEGELAEAPQMQMPFQTFKQQISPPGGLHNMNWTQNQFGHFQTTQPSGSNWIHQNEAFGQSGPGYGEQALPAFGFPPSQGFPPNQGSAQGKKRRNRQNPNQQKIPRHAQFVRDAKVPPSAESGGIPDATPAYLSQTLVPSRRLPHAKALLLVIDLNGTLLFRPDRHRPKNFQPRPHAAEFLQYVTRTFWVVIWSSAKPDNVAGMIKQLLPSYTTFDAATGTPITSPAGGSGCALVAIRSRKHFGLTEADYIKRVQCYKRLTSLWEDPDIARTFPGYERNEPGVPNRWDQTNTVLIDDSVEKARSEPHNLIQIEEFSGDGKGKRKDDMLPQVHDYINELCFQSDVSSYIRANPFRPGVDGWNPEAGEVGGNR